MPDHPDANDEGYVSFPNVVLENELFDLKSAIEQYELTVDILKKLLPNDVVIYKRSTDMLLEIIRAQLKN